MDISWSKTGNALQDFAKILICGQCGLKPASPMRFTNCGHFFCYNCAKSATKCFKCDVPVQPKEMNHDHMVSSLIRNCDIIADTINKRDLWDHINNADIASTSQNTTISKTICTPKNMTIPKNINRQNYKGETPLHIACLRRNVERVKFLLMLGADPNIKDNAGWTPLQEIVNYGGNIELCELLLEGGALPNTLGHEIRTPLHDAAMCNRIEEAKLLMQYHADKDVCDQYGKKPLDYCESEEMREILMGSHRSPYLSKKTPDLNQTLDRSFVVGQEKLVVFASNLKPENQKAFNLIAVQHKFRVLTTNSSSITHVIVETNEQNIAKLTVDILFAIVRGSWLLNSQWISLMKDLKDISDVDLEMFEVNGAPFPGVPKKARLNTELQKPRLFNNCFFYFIPRASGEYRIGDIHLMKNDLTKLVKEGEGTVLTREPNPNDIPQAIPFHTADDPSHPLHRCTHYIIYMPGKGEPRIKYKMPHIKSLPLVWLIECIEKFTLVDPAYLGLS